MTVGSPGLQHRLRAGPVLGSFVGIGHATVVEIMAWHGFDLLCVDAEHACLGSTEIEGLVRAADVGGVPALVRVPSAEPAIAHALEAGAAGVLVPRVGSAAEAARCAALVRYPPQGERGAGIGRAARYGVELADRIAHANHEVVLAVQIETREGLEQVAPIAAVDGVDVLFVGPGDLSVSLGCAMGSDAHTAAVQAIVGAAAQAGKLSGIFCRTNEQVAQWAQAGVRLFLLDSDLGLLAAGGAAAVAGGRRALSSITEGIDG